MNWKSRKFIAWITWTFLFVVCLIAVFFLSVSIPLPELIQMYGLVTFVYIGGEAGIDAVNKRIGK